MADREVGAAERPVRALLQAVLQRALVHPVDEVERTGAELNRRTLPVAAAVLFARHLLAQMDVPTRQAYTMALVAPDERAAAAGFTASARALAHALSPVLSGFALARAATALPFYVAGALKIVYDLSLYFRFRRLALPAADDGAAP